MTLAGQSGEKGCAFGGAWEAMEWAPGRREEHKENEAVNDLPMADITPDLGTPASPPSGLRLLRVFVLRFILSAFLTFAPNLTMARYSRCCYRGQVVVRGKHAVLWCLRDLAAVGRTGNGGRHVQGCGKTRVDG